MKYIFTLTLLITCLFSCKKGDTGPQGPAGIAGTAGTPGNTNVHSQIFFLSGSSWHFNSGKNELSDTVSCSLITESVVQNGAVQVYSTADSISYTALPFTDYSGVESVSFSYSIQPEKVILFIDANETLPTNPGDVTYKVVAIDGSARKMLQQKGVSLRDYPAVKNALNLRD